MHGEEYLCSENLEICSMTYRDALIESMTMLAQDPLTRFCGYGLLRGKNGNGMRNVPDNLIAEFPVAENLMAGAAMGMAMCGLKPLLHFERADFLFNAMDAIVNHLDKAALISRGEFSPCVIIRVVIGNKNKPLFTGPTHTQDPSEAMMRLVKFPVYKVRSADEVLVAYQVARDRQNKGKCSTLIFEEKDRY